MLNYFTFDILVMISDRKVIKLHRNQTAQKIIALERVLIYLCLDFDSICHLQKTGEGIRKYYMV